MINEDKNVYIKRQRERYQEIETRNGKSAFLTEVAQYLAVSRDHAIRLMNVSSSHSAKHAGPVRKCTEDQL